MLRSGIRARSNAPEAFEPGRGQLRIAHRVLDVLVSEIRLKGAGIMPFGSQRKATGMAQHVRVGLELEPGGLTSAFHHAGKAGRREGRLSNTT